MSATDGASTDGGHRGQGGDETERLDDHEYFQAVEEVFVGLRGAPLLLSPKDWHTAREWHREGIPLDLVVRTLEEVFERRRERGEEGVISSLRYCDRPVRAAWKEVRELTAVATRAGEPGTDGEGARSLPTVAERLDALAGALPADLPARDDLVERVRALGRVAEGGEAPEERAVEEALAELDAQVLGELIDGLGPEHRRELEEAADRSLGALAQRLPREELERARERLVAQKVRRAMGLPTLSLFAPEAEPAAEDDPA